MNTCNGLSVVNIEFTSRCNKCCACCGRRKLEKLQKTDWGDMDFELVKSVAEQLPENIIVQFHSSGEPLLYPRFGEAVNLFERQIKCMNTNAKLLLEKAEEVINNLETLTISVIEDDPEGDEQYEIVKKFLEIKRNKKPFMIYRLLGDVSRVCDREPYPTKEGITYMDGYIPERKERWYRLPGLITTRVLHDSMGSYDYKKEVTIPEHGICLDLLSHLLIDRYGDVYPCVRFNPNKYMRLGNIKNTSLEELWNNPYRSVMIRQHAIGNRQCSELCEKCEFYGCPTNN